MNEFNYEKDADGIVTVTMDMPGRPVNTMNDEYQACMLATVERLEKEVDAITGVVITSGKTTFVAGADLDEILLIKEGDEEKVFKMVQGAKGVLRRFELLPVPVAVAINGAALGGGYELCLSANYRVLLNDKKAVVGFPEASLGLMAAAGGVVRLTRKLGLQKALPFILESKKVKPDKALREGLVDELVDSLADLVPAAKAWVKANPNACKQPWDEKDYKIPGGTASDLDNRQFLLLAPVLLRKKTRGLLPAPEVALSIAAESTLLDIDTALTNESRAFIPLVKSAVAKNTLNTFFFGMAKLQKGASRPKSVEIKKLRKVGVLGAGMMGQSIAAVTAMAGIETVLKDVLLESAQNGKAYTEKLLDKEISRGRMDEAKKTSILELILATDKQDDIAGCDLVIEAVFEKLALKQEIARDTEGLLAEGGVIGTNTSSLPITMLAEGINKPESYIGMHFFSPVDKMPLVEIICGEKTSDEALALAFDYCQQIRKIPIVVNDARGFFTTRVFATFVDEGFQLLKDGIHPVLIDNLAQQAGMPVGPLTIQDEVTLTISHLASETNKEVDKMLGVASSCMTFGEAMEDVIDFVYLQSGRAGKQAGAGLYDYSESGERVPWQGLLDKYYKPEVDFPYQDIKDRILFRQILEGLSSFEEGVIPSVNDANIGSIMGIGFPPHTGGLFQFINTYGVKAFMARCAGLAENYGERFTPPAVLKEYASAEKAFC